MNTRTGRKNVLFVCGPPRSGSSTTALALGCAMARSVPRVGVIAVDPSPSMLESFGILGSTGVAHGRALMECLDISATFERLVREVATDDVAASALMDNPLYDTLTRTLPGAGDFMVLERVNQLRADGEFDLLVVDTPPSAPAGDFLHAVDRVNGFLGHPVYRALSVGQRTLGRVADAALSAFLGEVRNVAGHHMADDTTAFFRSLSSLEAGLRSRLGRAAETLGSSACGYVVVAEPRPEAVRDAQALVERFDEQVVLSAIVVNRVQAIDGRTSAPWEQRERSRSDALVAPLLVPRSGAEIFVLPDCGPGPFDEHALERLIEPFLGWDAPSSAGSHD